jgi:hypothetical protein
MALMGVPAEQAAHLKVVMEEMEDLTPVVAAAEVVPELQVLVEMHQVLLPVLERQQMEEMEELEILGGQTVAQG